jgi:hypothetical protein
VLEIALLSAVLVVLATTAVLVLVPVRVRLSLQGRADPSGLWAVGGGVQVGPVSVSAAAARGVKPRLVVQAFGRRVPLPFLARGKSAPRPARPPLPLLQRIRRMEAAYARFSRFLDPLDLALFLVRERRRIAVDRITVAARFGLDDPALTGSIMGSLLVLDTLLGARVSIEPDPIWMGEPSLSLSVNGSITLRPGLAVVDGLVFLAKHLRIRPPPLALPRASVPTLSA